MRAPITLLTLAFVLSCSASLWSNELVDTIVWLSFGGVAALLMWWGVWRQPARERLGWGCLAAGLTSWVLGDVAWEVLAWSADVPDVSIIDGFYLAGYVFFVAGIAVLTRTATGSLSPDAAIDALVLSIGIGVVFWVGLIAPASEPGSLLYRAVTAAYPLGALILLASLAWMRFHPGRRMLTPATGLLAGAIVLLILLEPLSAWFYLYEPNLDLEPKIDRLFQISFGLFALAPFVRGGGRTRADRNRLHPFRLVMLGAAMAAGPLTMYFSDDGKTPAVVASALISALVVVRFVGVARGQERAQLALSHRANHDELTGLANRSVLFEVLEGVAATGRKDCNIALLYIDADRFKEINDSHGHAVGDDLLVELSARIQQCIDPADIAVRLGGDEFVVVCESDAQAARAIADRLTELVAQPFHLGNLSLEVSVSVGVAAAEQTDFEPLRLLESADAALYQAKRVGRGRVVVFDDGIGSWLEAQHELEADLRAAVVAKQIDLRLLPVVNPISRSIVGCDARMLLREEGGDPIELALDQAFIHRSGLAGSVALWAIQAVIEIAQRKPDNTAESPDWVLFRVTSAQLRSREFVDVTCELLRNVSDQALGLVLEVTEDGLAAAIADEARGVEKLIELGVRFAVADFGAAGSTLTGVEQLPFALARIQTQSANPFELRVSDALGELARSLGLEVIESAPVGAMEITRLS